MVGVLIVLVIALLPIISGCFIITKQQKVQILETFGKYSGFRTAGLSMKLPWPIQIAVATVDLRIQEIAETVEIKSKDNAFLCVPVKVQVKVIPEKVKDAYYALDNPWSQILSYVVNQVRAKASSMTMDEIFSGKSDFEAVVETELKSTFEEYGFAVVNVLVDDPQPSDQLKEAFEKVLAAQRDKDAAVLEKEAVRERLVGRAEAEAESLRLKAKGYADQRNTMAEGNSKAIAVFCEGLNIDHALALKFFEGWDMRDAVREAAQGEGNTVLIPVEMGGMGRMAADLEALKGIGK
ncbi:regulator of protease activity HflC (stomatin/prohibitin superfamily) [Desulfobaculum xiamenense]|uniref:Regulator of protease activity HflC (Stomatin/prohibitin superfamily) n=1 Tax=Desulfobaculum xiamenense TaxID=995050 RepID=A0A846QN44_9BACT|nr:SPFH domain-containing protein [Desulfobaculum xiamenense]NJB66835.1 regulator of protease activity HflC (stomatin/prohibitin superfamily) [Desulfobaculum xiamenense]